MAILDQSLLPKAYELASKLRSEGVNVEVDFSGRKLDKQIKTAVKKHIPYVVFIGETELKSEKYSVKNTKTGEEESLVFERLVTHVKDKRRKYSVDDDELFE
jgi:histidyl-tRNA synthetase